MASYRLRMRDREMVAAIRAGEPAGLAAAYDAYAAGLHAYCRSLLTESGPATDAVVATFRTAVARLGTLQDPDRLRSWMFAIARNECHRRLRDLAASAGRAGSGSAVVALAHVLADADRSEPPDLVRAAIAGLGSDERDVIELSLDREQGDDSLAVLLGISRDEVRALAARARTRFEDALGALLIGRAGRVFCAGMEALLADWDGSQAQALRAAIDEHMRRCATCGDPGPSPQAPRSGGPWLLDAAAGDAGRAGTERTAAPTGAGWLAAVARSEGTGTAGTGTGTACPAPVDPGGLAGDGGVRPPRGPLAEHWGRAVTAGVAAVALVTIGSVYWAKIPHNHLRVQPGGPVPVVSLPSSPGSRAAPGAPGAAPVATSGHTTAPAPSPMHQSTTPAPTALPSTHSTSPAPPPAPGTLSAAPSTVTLHPQGRDGPPAGAFTLTANGGPVASFHIAVPAADAGVLTVWPASGSLAAGQVTRISVTLPPGYHTSLTAVLTISPGGLAVTAVYRPHSHGHHRPAQAAGG
jgi:RNA polymerase sigma factor (sigma-70 family)